MRKGKLLLFLMVGICMLSGCNTQTNQDTNQNGESSISISTSIMEIDTSDMFRIGTKKSDMKKQKVFLFSWQTMLLLVTRMLYRLQKMYLRSKEEGTYVLSGSLSEGMVIVEAEDTDKIHLVLDGVNISNSQSAALYIRSADKIFVTTASGTENTMENGGTYTAIDENNIDAAIFSKSDLTFNGEGTLTVTAQEGHGIVSKDDLVFTSGSYEITSASHGISGKDSVRIANGSYKITAGKDGIHAENTEDTSVGFVYLAGGTVDITSQQDGISASAWLQAEDGTYTILTGEGSANAQSQSGGEGGPMDHMSQEEEDTASIKGMKAAIQLVLKGGTYAIDAQEDALHSMEILLSVEAPIHWRLEMMEFTQIPMSPFPEGA